MPVEHLRNYRIFLYLYFPKYNENMDLQSPFNNQFAVQGELLMHSGEKFNADIEIEQANDGTISIACSLKDEKDSFGIERIIGVNGITSQGHRVYAGGDFHITQNFYLFLKTNPACG